MPSIIEELQWRGVSKQVIHTDQLRTLPAGTGVYCGVDPTMPALQIGNLLQLITLVRFQRFGFKPIVVIGGATAQIGDPSGKNQARPLISKSRIQFNTAKIKAQIAQIFPEIKIILNNHQWLAKLSWVNFINMVGRQFNVAQLLTHDTVKQRLATGLSVAEFNYLLAQAYDFFWVYKHHNCRVQIGGSDQWTNIISGLEYIRKRCGMNHQLAGLTTNLIVNRRGEKLGKTTQNTIFVDEALTAKYNFFNFFYNQPDDMVDMYLKFFTFINPEQLKKLDQTSTTSMNKRLKQTWLAKSLFSLVYGEDAYQQVAIVQKLLFQTPIEQLTVVDCQLMLHYLSRQDTTSDANLMNICQNFKICQSQTELKRLIVKRAIRINNQLITKPQQLIRTIKPLYKHYWLLKKGKQQFFLITSNLCED